MRKQHQSGFAHLLLLVILIAGLIATVILIGKTQIFRSKAAGDKQVILLEPKADNLTAIGGARLNNKTLEFQKPTTACSQSLQAQIDQAAAGATLVAQPCLYRETVTINKPLILDGNGMAEIRGSDVFTEWEQKGNYWQSKRQINFTAYSGIRCQNGVLCRQLEQVFLDGQQLNRVISSGGNLRSGQFDISSDKRVLLADNPAGRLMEVSDRQYWVEIKSNNVTVKNFVMRHASNDAQNGAIRAEGVNASVENNGIYQSHGAGIKMWGANASLVNNDIGWHGQIGFTGGFPLVRGNFIHGNNTAGYQPGDEAGGFKIVGATTGLWENNEVYKNSGFGMWCDMGCSNVTIRNNRVYDNTWSGIDYEVSRGANIYGNLVWRNGLSGPGWFAGGGLKAGIWFNNGQDSRIHDNILAWNRGGIIINASDRACDEFSQANLNAGGWLTIQAINNVVNNKVYGNKIIMPEGTDAYGLGFAQQPAEAKCPNYRSPLFNPDSGNQGYNNQLWYSGGTGRFSWNNQTMTSLDDYNKNPGQTGNSWLSNADKDSILVSNRLPAQDSSCSAQNSNYTGMGVLKFNVASGGDFSFWSRAASGADRTFWIQIDNDCPQQLSAERDWSWVKTANKQPAAGAHIVKVWGQNGVKIDRFLASLNSSCIPAGTGDNCLPVATTPVTTLTLSKSSDFVSGETVTLSFNSSGGSGNITIHTAIWQGITDPSQKTGNGSYQGLSAGSGQRTATVPFYVEYLAIDSQNRRENTKTMLVTAAPGDLNNDGTVNRQDAQVFFEQYGIVGKDNRQINGYNYAEIIQNFGR